MNSQRLLTAQIIIVFTLLKEASNQKLADGSKCTAIEQCTGYYCATKTVSKKVIFDGVVQTAVPRDASLCCSALLDQPCGTCRWAYLETCDPCCGRLRCSDGRCIVQWNLITPWSEWSYAWKNGVEDPTTQVCSNERLKRRYRTVPDFFLQIHTDFKPLAHIRDNSCLVNFNQKCNLIPTCKENVNIRGISTPYLGCYYSDLYFLDWMVEFKNMTPSTCNGFCKHSYYNVKFYGIYHGSICGCARQIYSTTTAPVYRDERKCVDKCVGTTDIICGGPKAASMFCIIDPFV